MTRYSMLLLTLMDDLHLLWRQEVERSASVDAPFLAMCTPLRSFIYRSHRSLARGVSIVIWDISCQWLTEQKNFAFSPEALAVSLNFLVNCI